MLARPEGGEVSRFLGRPVPIGPFDNAAIHTQLLSGLPGPSVAVPIEVKNLRDWIYPSSQELYQLLDKSARLQQTCSDVPIVPVLICRRANVTAFRMAKDLGFYIIATSRQYITAVDEDDLLEVRQELGFTDLALHEGADELIVRRFTRVFPIQPEQRASRWALTSAHPQIRQIFAESRTSVGRVRSRNLEILRDLADEAGLYETEGW